MQIKRSKKLRFSVNLHWPAKWSSFWHLILGMDLRVAVRKAVLEVGVRSLRRCSLAWNLGSQVTQEKLLGVQAMKFAGRENRIGDSCRSRGLIRMRSIVIFAADNRRAQAPFSEVIIERNFRIVQEASQSHPMFAHAF